MVSAAREDAFHDSNRTILTQATLLFVMFVKAKRYALIKSIHLKYLLCNNKILEKASYTLHEAILAIFQLPTCA